MRFVLLLFCFTQAFAVAIVREETSDGSWLEARINDDRTLGGLIFSDGSSVIYDYEDAVKEIERKTGKRLSDGNRRKLHDQISGQNYGYHDIVEEGYWLFNE